MPADGLARVLRGDEPIVREGHAQLPGIPSQIAESAREQAKLPHAFQVAALSQLQHGLLDQVGYTHQLLVIHSTSLQKDQGHLSTNADRCPCRQCEVA